MSKELPCEAWINLTMPIIKEGLCQPVSCFSLTKCPFVAASGAFSGRRPGRSRAIAATAVEGVREKWHRMGMLIHEMLTACLWVFLGRHSGLSWDIRRLDGLLGVNQSAPAMLGELSCDLPRAASSKRWYCTCAPGCSFGFSSVPQPYLCSFVHLFIRSLLPSTNLLHAWLCYCCLIWFWRTHVSTLSVTLSQPIALLSVVSLPCPIHSKVRQEDIPNQA